MRLPRMTTRRLLIAVALAGFACYGVYLQQLGRYYEQQADLYHHLRWDLREGPALFDPTYYTKLGPEETARLERAALARQQWQERMEEKYRRAARRPWLPVEPESPPPE